ncbi:hypothetical protein AB0I28_19730 [Phytomonospora sp. NPDC050363]|uniref:hypothetical protein n=1 Tax=Phytomonospora sp. NPDC050363 TaxID=3155642 RepID=UPI0033E564B5
MTIPQAPWRDVALNSLDHTKLALDSAAQHTELATDALTRILAGADDLGAADTTAIARRASAAHADILAFTDAASAAYVDAVTALELLLPPDQRIRTNALETNQGPAHVDD